MTASTTTAYHSYYTYYHSHSYPIKYQTNQYTPDISWCYSRQISCTYVVICVCMQYLHEYMTELSPDKVSSVTAEIKRVS